MGFDWYRQAKRYSTSKDAKMQARQRLSDSGGFREAYLAFLPFDSFPDGFYGYVKKSEFVKAMQARPKPLGKLM